MEVCLNVTSGAVLHTSARFDIVTSSGDAEGKYTHTHT